MVEKETFALALQHHKKKSYKIAEDLYEKLLKINPYHFEVIFLLGSLQIQTKNFIKATQLLKRATQIQSNHKSAHNYLGIAFYKLGEFQKAKSCYEKSIQINPSNSDPYWNLHSHALDFDEALNILIKLIDIAVSYTHLTLPTILLV